MSQVELTTLGKSCEFFNGKAHEKSIDENGKYIVVNSKFISQEGRVVKRTKVQMFPLYKGDIVMVMSDVPNGKALAKCFIIDKDDTYSLNQRICCIRSKEFDTKYLYYQLNRNEHFLAFNNGENQTNLRKDDILDCPLIKPSTEEQKRMVAELDIAFSSLEKVKENLIKNINNTREIFEQELQTSFNTKGNNWTEAKLQTFADIKHGYAFNGEDFETDYLGSNAIVLTPGNFSENSQLYFTEKNTKRCKGKYPKDYLFKLGELAVVMTDLSSHMKILGKPAFIESENILHNQRIGKFIFKNNNVEKRYLYYFLQTSKYLAKIKETATGTMVRHTAPKRILDMIIHYPISTKEQISIVNRLDELKIHVKNLVRSYQLKLENIDELKSGVLKRAFENELIEAE
jgi:type I restriction enzyme, S subunit